VNRCNRYLITGRVQGVWFRGSTQQQAVLLGLRGFARNLADGSVEVVACGDEAALEQLQEWLWRGPSNASVLEVTCEPYEGEDYSGFTTL